MLELRTARKGGKEQPTITFFAFSLAAKRDFFCQRALLLRQMTYFTAYLQTRASDPTVEIDVHCDIEVFEWLMSYISRKRPLFGKRLGTSHV